MKLGSKQWIREWGGGEPTQIYPINDLREHVTTGTDCWCLPHVDEDANIVSHNSLDGRELYEERRRKPS